MIRDRDLIKVGYWRERPLGPESPLAPLFRALFRDLPLAQDFVDPAWGESERSVVLAYLKPPPHGGGRVHEVWMGWSDCRICGKCNGTRCLTDGAFVWPEGLGHYVEEHALRPDQSFVAHIMKRNA